MSFKVGDEFYDQDLPNLKGNRWNGEPLSAGFGWGEVIEHFGLFMLVKFKSYPLPIMFSKDGMRFDRAGRLGSKGGLSREKMNNLGLLTEADIEEE
jgi:hypothetical protein